jgi:alkylation response protein AidB-like acyl-CoA dehydrogenase
MHRLTEADREVQAAARTFAAELIPYEVEAELAGGELPPEVAARHRARAQELGLTATNIATEHGGRGLTTLQQVLAQEQGGRVTNGLAWCMTTPPGWLPAVATPYQRERWLEPTVRGEAEECYAITEELAGSDVADLAATARRDGDDYLLDGEKWHVTSYNEASYAFFQARLVGGDHDGEHAMFFVDLPSPGVRVVRTPAYSHTIGHQHPIVAFESVRVPSTHLVGAEGDGMTFAHEWFRFERLMIAARCLGAAERLVEEASAFAQQRVVGGQALAEYQLVQAMLADSVTELFAARTMVYATARGIDDGVDRKVAHAQCSMVKLYASEMAGRVADRAVQIFGGRGYMRENVAERFYRELRVERIWEGASEVQRVIIAGQLAKRGLSALV